ncbi:acyl-CoA N-acyltransferase [Thozetella sp. PMI_491]|nr:acyl-CoA N-acyltransferase [Thozetella sp. PMI_491]
MGLSSDSAGLDASPSFRISQASTPEDLAAVADIFTAYTQWLDLDLTFQNYAEELAKLPGKYVPPTGALLLARDSTSGEVLGCIALRPLTLGPDYAAGRDGVRFCEIKRLYTYPAARGRGVARALVRAVIATAELEGYQEALLDTLAKMVPAIQLYKSEGFVETERYYGNPLENVVYMTKKLG